MGRKKQYDDGLTPYQRWYARNKKAHNKKRRDKYQEDTDYREKKIQEARDYRSSVRMPEHHLQIQTEEGVRFVYQIQVAADWAECTVEELDYWRKKGLLGAPLYYGKEKVYLKRHMLVIHRLVALLSQGSMDKESRTKWKSYLSEVWDARAR